MKHAGAAALEGIPDPLAEIRLRDGLRAKTGIFYRNSRQFLHFREDQAGMFADLLNPEGFERYCVNTGVQRTAFLAALDRALKLLARCRNGFPGSLAGRKDRNTSRLDDGWRRGGHVEQLSEFSGIVYCYFN